MPKEIIIKNPKRVKNKDYDGLQLPKNVIADQNEMLLKEGIRSIDENSQEKKKNS